MDLVTVDMVNVDFGNMGLATVDQAAIDYADVSLVSLMNMIHKPQAQTHDDRIHVGLINEMLPTRPTPA